MTSFDVTVNVRHRVGLLGRSMIAATKLLNRVGIRVPMILIVWAINHSSYISVNGGRWQRMPMNLTTQEFA